MIRIKFNEISPALRERVDEMILGSPFHEMVTCLSSEADALAAMAGNLRVFQKHRSLEAAENQAAAEKLAICVEILTDVMQQKHKLARAVVLTEA